METTKRMVLAANLEEVHAAGCLTVRANGLTLALFAHNDRVYAVDNRCPHMGFPLNRGTVSDGVLTCHWHHARFDLASGGTFDQWADDVVSYPVEIRDGAVWVDLSPQYDVREHQRQRLQDGLERDISLVTAKAISQLLERGEDPASPFRIGLDFGSRYRAAGWGQGLTILTCMVNLLPHLDQSDRAQALYHGLVATARDSAGMPPRFTVDPLPGSMPDSDTLKRWFRQFIEVRDAEAAERCIVTAVRAGADDRQLADMLFAAATDHRYLDTGHRLDFTNKALEALEVAGWKHAERVLTGLVAGYAEASRMEESNAWRHPVDLIALLEGTFEALPAVLAEGQAKHPETGAIESDRLVEALLGDDPAVIVEMLLAALRAGDPPDEVAGWVTYAAARRIVHFHTSNEFGDWDTALHTFAFANAVQMGLRRVYSPELVRGVFDAAMSVYLDRFLNIPAAPLPVGEANADPDALIAALPNLFDQHQPVDETGRLIASYLASGGDASKLRAALGGLLLREDRDFHTIQTVEAAFRQQEWLDGTPRAHHMLVAAGRYLAAHMPTMRSQNQTYDIAQRLSRGDHLHED